MATQTTGAQSADAADPGIRPAAVCGATYRGYSTKHCCHRHRMNLASAPCIADGLCSSPGVRPAEAGWVAPTHDRSEGGRESLPTARDLDHVVLRPPERSDGQDLVKSTGQLSASSRRRNTVATRSSRDPRRLATPPAALDQDRLSTASASLALLGAPQHAAQCGVHPSPGLLALPPPTALHLAPLMTRSRTPWVPTALVTATVPGCQTRVEIIGHATSYLLLSLRLSMGVGAVHLFWCWPVGSNGVTKRLFRSRLAGPCGARVTTIWGHEGSNVIIVVVTLDKPTK